MGGHADGHSCGGRSWVAEEWSDDCCIWREFGLCCFRFPREVSPVAVRWYLRYGLSYREVEELLAERGIAIDHVTIYRWCSASPWSSSRLPGRASTLPASAGSSMRRTPRWSASGRTCTGRSISKARPSMSRHLWARPDCPPGASSPGRCARARSRPRSRPAQPRPGQPRPQHLTDLSHGNLLADGPLHSARGPGKRTGSNPGTAPRAHSAAEDADPCQSLVPPAALEGPIPRTSRGLTIKRPGCRLAIGPLTCTSWWANDRTWLICGYGIFAGGCSRVRRGDLPAFRVLGAVRRVRWRRLRVR